MGARHSTLHRISNILIGANPQIEGLRERRFASLLSAFLLATIPFATLTIVFGDLLSNNIGMLLLFTIVLVFSVYLVSRTCYYKIAVTITVVIITLAPLLIWFFVANWQPQDISRPMPWIIIALAVGAFFTDERVVLVQAIVISSIMIFVASFVRSIPVFDYDNHLLTIGILSGIVIVSSRMIGLYMREIENQSIELENQNRELEIYTRLLRHDLSNDLQAIINSVELSKMLLSVNLETADENLEQSLNFGLRMQKLLHVFRLPKKQSNANLIEEIQKIAKESEQTHCNLSIQVSWTNDAEEETTTASRLLPLVWTNIFRNASQHAGESPIVTVNISIVDQCYHIVIIDNGPGIPPEKRENLLKKTANLEEQDKGIGLYLSRLIVESHGGSLELLNTPETQFVIKIPTS